jgi:hypothetical protein
LLKKYEVTPEHANEFGKVVIQDNGRMKPINTFSSELLRKVSKSDTYEGMNSDQAFLSMTQFPQYWYGLPIIYLKRGNDSIRKLIGVEKEAKYAPLISFFDETGNYKLAKFLETAYKEPVPNQFQKDFIEADKKVNLLYSALSGQILKVFPRVIFFSATLLTQVNIPLRVNFQEIIIHQVVNKVDGFACRLHLRTQLLVDIREFMEREYRFFDGIAFLHRLEIEVSHLFLSQHYFYGIVDVRFLVSLTDKRNGSRGTRICFDYIHLVIFDGKLNIDQTHGLQGQGDFLGIGFNLPNHQIPQVVGRKHRIRVPGVNTCWLNVLHNPDDVDIFPIANRISFCLNSSFQEVIQ